MRRRWGSTPNPRYTATQAPRKSQARATGQAVVPWRPPLYRCSKDVAVHMQRGREPGSAACTGDCMAKPQIESEPKPPFPAKKLAKPGLEADLRPRPKYEAPKYKPANKLQGKAALITGGDSG